MEAEMIAFDIPEFAATPLNISSWT